MINTIRGKIKHFKLGVQCQHAMPLTPGLHKAFHDDSLRQWILDNVEDPINSFYIEAMTHPATSLFALKFKRDTDALACRLTFGD